MSWRPIFTAAPLVCGERAPAECQRGRLSGPIATLLRSLSGVGAAVGLGLIVRWRSEEHHLLQTPWQ
eukprot:5244803-Alexandrium_andersonii.AAC.1